MNNATTQQQNRNSNQTTIMPPIRDKQFRLTGMQHGIDLTGALGGACRAIGAIGTKHWLQFEPNSFRSIQQDSSAIATHPNLQFIA